MEAPKSAYKHARNTMQNEAQKWLQHEVYKTFTKQENTLNKTCSGGQNKATFSSDQGPKTATSGAAKTYKNGTKKRI